MLPILPMKLKLIVIKNTLLILFIMGIHHAHAMENSAAVTRLFPLDGVAGFIQGKAQGLIAQRLTQDAPGWFAEAFQSHRVYEGVTSKVKVVSDIKQRMSSWAPSVSRQVLREVLFQNAITKEEVAELEALSQSIEGALNASLEGMLDSLAGTLYDQAVMGTEPHRWPPSEALIRQQLERYGSIAPSLSQLMGDATVAGIRSHVSSLMEGKVPDGVLEALSQGDDALRQYLAQWQNNPVSSTLSKLTQSVLMRPRVTLPTGAYAGILAASAAGHFARAFSGWEINPEEIKRGLEVTRVMIWQVQKKERVNVALLSLAGVARGMAARFGGGEVFEEGILRLQKPMEQIQKLTDQLDQTILGKWNDVKNEVWFKVKPTVLQLQQRLEEVRLAVGTPLRNQSLDIIQPVFSSHDHLSDQLTKGKSDSVRHLYNEDGELIGMQWFQDHGSKRIREVAYRYQNHMLSVVVDSQEPFPWLREDDQKR